MNTAIGRWHGHRFLVDRLGRLAPFSPGGRRKRWLFISEHGPICQAQLFPFFFHRRDFAQRHRIEMRELPLRRFQENRHAYHEPIDAVSLQTWFDLSPEALGELVGRVRTTWPGAKLAYFDWFAPTDLHYAEVLATQVVAYLKKHALRDFAQYAQPTLGDTNLTDYYARRFKLALPETRGVVPEGFRDKLVRGTHFAFSDHLLPYFSGHFPQRENRSIDLHARIAVTGTEWYALMRQEALDRVTAAEDRLKVACRGRVSRKQYFQELFDAKLCLSPFGYGEVCWRDFEAMCTGSLVLKPDVSHLDCYPEVFVPYETYVPLAWDLSDLDEKTEHYLKRPAERESIARNAFDRINLYFRQHRFPDDIRPLLVKLGLAS